MKIEEIVKLHLLMRGFSEETQLNNRGLIGATIDETILAVVKNMDTSSAIIGSDSEQPDKCPYIHCKHPNCGCEWKL